jgi:hypothetical protein
MNCKKSNPGLRWFQSDFDALNMGRVYFVFNPPVYSQETLTKANQLIKTCLYLWKTHGIENPEQLRAVEIMERQYFNNQRRIYHFERFYAKKIEDLRKQFEKLSIS